MSKLFSIMWGIVTLILFLLLIGGLTVSIITHNICNNECIDRGTRFYELLPNGKWFSLEDMCICYFENKPGYKFILGANK